MAPRKAVRRAPKTEPPPAAVEPAAHPPRTFPTRYVSLVVALLALSALLLANKSLLVAAVVNGRPIWRWELNRVLQQRYGKQTLEALVSERLIQGEAAKQGVVVSPAEVRSKEEEIVKDLGGTVRLEEILKIQGVTKGEFDQQVTMQLMLQKLLTKDLTITDADIERYIATNRALLVATEEAAIREEARRAILEAHISEKLQPWFNDLKAKAKILRFL